jgi:hypothetical protein
MRIVNRLGATFTVAALITALLSASFASSADAASRHANRTKGFVAPTLIGVAGPATCVEVSENTYEVTVTFVVTGGRYTNLGNPANEPTYGDNVRAGGKRYVPSVTTTFHGWPNGVEFSPVEVDLYYSQAVAPIGKGRNFSAWRILESEQRVNLSCA